MSRQFKVRAAPFSQGNMWGRNIILDRMSLTLIITFEDPDDKPLKFVDRVEPFQAINRTASGQHRGFLVPAFGFATMPPKGMAKN
jgi:hypothetical protein